MGENHPGTAAIRLELSANRVTHTEHLYAEHSSATRVQVARFHACAFCGCEAFEAQLLAAVGCNPFFIFLLWRLSDRNAIAYERTNAQLVGDHEATDLCTAPPTSMLRIALYRGVTSEARLGMQGRTPVHRV